MKIILASASERRKDLLKRIIKSFEIRISNFNEKSVIFDGNIEKYVEKLSEGKAQNISENLEEDSIIIGCDTVVYFNKDILGKPKNKQDAFKMLEMLSGNVHKVYSGITLLNNKTKKVISDHVCTEVKFSKIDKNEIFKYIDTGEPMDKAGAYGIQGYGGIFVEKINGCYYNVVGLPLNKLSFMLKEMGVNL